jgi:D-arabinose 1-dehydrogenase-like Zn-dependent alcohol dehydrogenase
MPVHPGDLIARRIRIIGRQQNGREYLYEALQIATSGKLKVKAEIYSLDRITDAYGRVASGKVRFPRGYSAHRLTLVSANSL